MKPPRRVAPAPTREYILTDGLEPQDIYRNGKKIMAVSVEEPSADEIRMGTPTLLFEASRMVDQDGTFDVAPDGQRFLIVETDERRQDEIHIVLNWLAELRHLVPTIEN